jgi:hypothetical protein
MEAAAALQAEISQENEPRVRRDSPNRFENIGSRQEFC